MTDYTFVLNAVIAVLLPAICSRYTSDSKVPKLVFLRKTSIVIYFTHFVPVTVFHVLYIKHLMPYEYGMMEFLVVFALAFTIACAVVRLSDKFKFLKYLY